MNTNDQQKKSGLQNQPSTQKSNDQQQHQGAQQTPKPDATKAPEAAGNTAAGTGTADAKS